MDIKLIIRKTLVYLTVVTTLVLFSLSVVSLASHLFVGLALHPSLFSTLVAVIVFLSCFPLLHKQVQRWVDSKFFRQYADREEKLYELSREVITHTTPEALGEALMRVITDALHPQRATLFLRARDSAGFIRVSERDASQVSKDMADHNALSRYFIDHPQPFVQDSISDLGSSQNTRSKREDEA